MAAWSPRVAAAGLATRLWLRALSQADAAHHHAAAAASRRTEGAGVAAFAAASAAGRGCCEGGGRGGRLGAALRGLAPAADGAPADGARRRARDAGGGGTWAVSNAPRAINAELLEAPHVAGVLRVVAARHASFNHVNASTAWHRLAKLVQRDARRGGGPAAAAAAADAPDAVRALRSRTAELAPEMLPQNLSNTLWALATLRDAAGLREDADGEVVRALLEHVRRLTPEFGPQSVSNTLWALATLRLPAPEVVDPLARRFAAGAGEFTPQGLGNCLWALATLRHTPTPAGLDAVARELCARPPTAFVPQELSNALWAFATFTHHPGDERLEALADMFVPLLPGAAPQAVCTVLWAFATLGAPPARLLAAVDRHRLDWRRFNPQDLGTLAWSLALLGESGSPLFDRVWAAAMARPASAYEHEGLRMLYHASLERAMVEGRLPGRDDGGGGGGGGELLAAARRSWLVHAQVNSVTELHRSVRAELVAVGLEPEVEYAAGDGILSVDLALPEERVALEVDGPWHFTSNRGEHRPLGRTLSRDRLLAAHGWRVVAVPYYEWIRLRTPPERRAYLGAKLDGLVEMDRARVEAMDS